MSLFGSTTTDVLAAKLKGSALERDERIKLAQWLIDAIESVNPRFDSKRFLKLAGLKTDAPETQYSSREGS